jgi:hypothetical protein
MAFQRTPMIRPTEPRSSALPRIDADGLAILAERRGEFISEGNGVE